MGFADPRWGELPWHLGHLLCLAQQSSSWQLPLVLHTTTPNEGCRPQPDPVLYCAQPHEGMTRCAQPLDVLLNSFNTSVHAAVIMHL